jgi:hypothetical protein
MPAFGRILTVAAFTLILPALTACSGGGGVGSNPASLPSTSTTDSQMVDTLAEDRPQNDVDPDNGDAVLKRLNKITTIGSTVDPTNGDQNPYGLDIAPIDAGLLKADDLVVCNFNDSANVQGNGTTIIALHPKPGSTPKHIAQNGALKGCTANALGPTDNIWAAAFSANDNPIFTPNGALVTTLPGGPWHHPFGQTFAPARDEDGAPAFYESNAMDGSIVRIKVNPSPPTFTFDVIATGFAVNGGAPGSILGPSGLQYDAEHDRLYVVDGANNTLSMISHVSKIPAGGITVSGTTFGGPFRKQARLIFSGPPLNGPISSALLGDGHIVLGNTLDPDGTNLMVEIKTDGHLLATKNVDTGTAGALFGMVARGHDGNDTKLYFNDDNDNTVKLLTR